MKSFQEFTSNLHEESPKIGGDSDVKKVLDNFKKGRSATGEKLPKESIPLQSKQPFIKPDKKVINQLDALKNSDSASSKNIMNKLSAREKMNRAQSDASGDMSDNIRKRGNTYSPGYNNARDNARERQFRQSANTSHAGANVTFSKDAKNIEPKASDFKPTDPSSLNVSGKNLKPKKIGLGIKFRNFIKNTGKSFKNNKGNKGNLKTTSRVAGGLAGIDSLLKGEGVPRAALKTFASSLAVKAFKPLARNPKTRVLANVIGAVTANTVNKKLDKKPKSPIPPSGSGEKSGGSTTVGVGLGGQFFNK